MMAIIPAMAENIAMFLLIIGIVQILKQRGVFDDSHQPVFDRLVTEFALPAIVFGFLTTTLLRAEWILPVLIVNAAVFVVILIAWGICRAASIPPGTTGTLIILSAWGSTYTAGIPLLTSVYGSSSEEIALGHVLGVFGFALPFFTIGILVAGYFGLHERGEPFALVPFLKTFLYSPVFLAFWSGLLISVLFSFFHLPGEDIFYDVFADFFLVIQHAIGLLVWIAIGLLIRPIRTREFLPLFALVVVIHLLLLPGIILAGSCVAGLPAMQKHVAVILAAMPSGAIAGVIADRYGCNGKLAALIIIGTCVIGLVTLPLFLVIVPGM